MWPVNEKSLISGKHYHHYQHQTSGFSEQRNDRAHLVSINPASEGKKKTKHKNQNNKPKPTKKTKTKLKYFSTLELTHAELEILRFAAKTPAMLELNEKVHRLYLRAKLASAVTGLDLQLCPKLFFLCYKGKYSS